MPKHAGIEKVMVIGSGPIVIGQAAEFDYAGTQAVQALKEEGVSVVLVNSNPATIQTDIGLADRVYIEPITADSVKNIIRIERPDAIVPGLGGQTGLNMAMELYDEGFLDEMGVKLLGTPAHSIKAAEDRKSFKELMQSIREPVIDSVIATDVDEAVAFAGSVGYPLIIRPAYTLGGTGGGVAYDEGELRVIAMQGLSASRVRQILVERSVAGWKEIEFEAMRDGGGNCILVCSMENVDPVGIHTGDSIVVAPAVTLNNDELGMLREASENIIDALRIEGGCNIQFALHPDNGQYYIIEVNPRVSRSSALASKATGYPIAKVSAKVALGLRLDEIINSLTGSTTAADVPVVEYTVLKFPRWPFDKFVGADKLLGTRMKATGEVMSIAPSFGAALNKAIRSLELGMDSLEWPAFAALTDGEVTERLSVMDDMRLFLVAEAMRRGVSIELIHEKTMIDKYFLGEIKTLVDMELTWKREPRLSALLKYKQAGFPDSALARWAHMDAKRVRDACAAMNIAPSYFVVDTKSGRMDAQCPYFYSGYDAAAPANAQPQDNTVVVLGAGPIRIGQGIEFDYCSVRAVKALRAAGYRTVIINNNPETVSTDFDTADRLYFEPLTPEDVGNVLKREKPIGVMVQFGGQTAIKLAKSVSDMGYAILGTQLDTIDRAEDRERFDQLLEELNVARPEGRTVFTEKAALEAANALGYPVLVRPSYVLGGQGMEIAYEDAQIAEFMSIINRTEQEHPVLVDKYMPGVEAEVDAICDGEDVLIPGIMEHIERAGVHSGDSISVYPPQHLTTAVKDAIVEITGRLARALGVRGVINIQFIISDDKVYIIEVNPRSSRTIPYMSKVTGVPMVDVATQCAMGKTLKELGYASGMLKEIPLVAVKVPVFSFEKLKDVEISLGPEMKSTGEVLGIAPTLNEALLKGLLAAGMHIKRGGEAILTVANNDKRELVPIAERLERMGFTLLATSGTTLYLHEHCVGASAVNKAGEEPPTILDALAGGQASLVISTPTRGRQPDRDGFRIRRMAVERSIPCLTSLDTAKALVDCLALDMDAKALKPICISAINGNDHP